MCGGQPSEGSKKCRKKAFSSAGKRPFLHKMKGIIIIVAEIKQSVKSRKLNDLGESQIRYLIKLG